MTPYRTIRKQNGLTQQQLSERLKVPLALVRKYEKPRIQPPLPYRRRFMILFDVEWDQLSSDHNINHKQDHKGDHNDDEKRKNEAVDHRKPENR